ncbi:AAA family ATPase [Acetobacterium wieringae]|uniref:AAA family ATPase n=1 Tax=Acetobacterium wieringae TaxID=52694 RepID=A0ABY6HHM4_9FIRM|nr:AAA family ATPase [Acetobacterium wieringae]UYO63073.1 AAA family ATPase [Acetobacterium wieringae]
MKIESIKIKNYKVLRDVEIKEIPSMAVFLGVNGSGKSTLFDVFGFLNDALMTNIRAALAKRGGFNEVISRGEKGDIEFEIKFRPSAEEPLITYELVVSLDEKKNPIIKKEVLRFRRGQVGSPWKVLDFAYGEGTAAVGELNTYDDVKNASRKEQKLDSPDILAIKGLGQFKEFVAVSQLRRLIEDWYVSDFQIEDARIPRDAGYSEQLSRTGDNLALVAKYLYENYYSVFENILETMKERIPGITNVEAQETTDGRIVLRFQDGNFKDPFISRYMSDGTIKMFTYLILLNDPSHHALLCVEEPENQLYPQLLSELAEEFRLYSVNEGQVFISTHSPDFLDAVELDELYCLVKNNGFTEIKKASNNDLIKSLFESGDLLGDLWRQGLLEKVI